MTKPTTTPANPEYKRGARVTGPDVFSWKESGSLRVRIRSVQRARTGTLLGRGINLDTGEPVVFSVPATLEGLFEEAGGVESLRHGVEIVYNGESTEDPKEEGHSRRKEFELYFLERA